MAPVMLPQNKSIFFFFWQKYKLITVPLHVYRIYSWQKSFTSTYSLEFHKALLGRCGKCCVFTLGMTTLRFWRCGKLTGWLVAEPGLEFNSSILIRCSSQHRREEFHTKRRVSVVSTSELIEFIEVPIVSKCIGNPNPEIYFVKARTISFHHRLLLKDEHAQERHYFIDFWTYSSICSSNIHLAITASQKRAVKRATFIYMELSICGRRL